MDEHVALKQSIIDMGVRLIRSGLVVGTAGNISARLPGLDYLYITPSGMPYEELAPDDIVGIDYEGQVVEGQRRPSIEYVMHACILRARQDINAVVHTHSLYATAVAAARKPIPAILESVIIVNGYKIDVAEFASAGSRRLAENAMRTLGSGRAVLLANHGVIGVGADLGSALAVCVTVENAAQVYLMSQLLGGAVVIPDGEVAEQIEFFKNKYGQR